MPLYSRHSSDGRDRFLGDIHDEEDCDQFMKMTFTSSKQMSYRLQAAKKKILIRQRNTKKTTIVNSPTDPYGSFSYEPLRILLLRTITDPSLTHPYGSFSCAVLLLRTLTDPSLAQSFSYGPLRIPLFPSFEKAH